MLCFIFCQACFYFWASLFISSFNWTSVLFYYLASLHRLNFIIGRLTHWWSCVALFFCQACFYFWSSLFIFTFSWTSVLSYYLASPHRFNFIINRLTHTGLHFLSSFFVKLTFIFDHRCSSFRLAEHHCSLIILHPSSIKFYYQQIDTLVFISCLLFCQACFYLWASLFIFLFSWTSLLAYYLASLID